MNGAYSCQQQYSVGLCIDTDVYGHRMYCMRNIHIAALCSSEKRPFGWSIMESDFRAQLEAETWP